MYQLLDQHRAQRLSQDFGDGSEANVVLRVTVDASEAKALRKAATDSSSGRVTSTILH